jgi:hypothetical protein
MNAGREQISQKFVLFVFRKKNCGVFCSFEIFDTSFVFGGDGNLEMQIF